jgi:hypothetical protein
MVGPQDKSKKGGLIMDYEQLSLPMDKKFEPGVWRAMGYAVFFCPNCKRAVSYPINTNMYSVVCKCGWFTLPDDNGDVYWASPMLVTEAKLMVINSQNRQN